MHKRDKTITFKGKGSLFIPRNIIRSEYPESKKNNDDNSDNITTVANPDYVLVYTYIRSSDNTNIELLSWKQYCENVNNKLYLTDIELIVAYPLYKNKPNAEALQPGLFPYGFEYIENIDKENPAFNDIVGVFINQEITEDFLYDNYSYDIDGYSYVPYGQLNDDEFANIMNYAFNQIGSFYWYGCLR